MNPGSTAFSNGQKSWPSLEENCDGESVCAVLQSCSVTAVTEFLSVKFKQRSDFALGIILTLFLMASRLK